MTQFDLPPSTGPALENLINRNELLRLMRESHLRWMHRTDDPYIKEIHRTLAIQLEAIRAQYSVLIDALENRR